MMAQEAINNIDDVLSSTVNYDESIDYQLTSYDIDWLEMAKEALEKQIPKKVYKNLKETYGNTHPYHCPNCKSYVSMRGYVPRDKVPVNKIYIYCMKCGQALDWSDTE